MEAAAAFAGLFPTLLPPVQPWHYRAFDGCINSQGKDYFSDYPGDSPEDVLDQYIADLNALCKTYGGWLNTYSRVPGIVPTIHASDADSLYPAVVAQGYKLHVQHDPLPSCPSCQAYSEDKTLSWPDRQCGHNRVIGDWNQPGFFREDNPSYGVCKCGAGRTYVAAEQRCVPRRDRYWEGDTCPRPEFGNPINALKGFKRQSVDLGGSAVLGVRLGYDTRRKVRAEDPLAVYSMTAPESFGPLWNSSLHKTLVVQGSAVVQAGRGAGDWISFVKNGSAYVATSGADDKLVPFGSWWVYSDPVGLTQETYDPNEIMTSMNLARGGKLSYYRSTDTTPPDEAPKSGLVIRIADQFGHELRFKYEQPANTSLPVRIKEMIDISGATTQFRYDSAGNLSQIVWPDMAVRTFVYEDASLPWALTGIIDENNVRHATYGYDSEGRAVSTEYAGGTNKFSTSWTTPPSWVIEDTYDPVEKVVWRDHRWALPLDPRVTLPNGSITELTATDVLGLPRLSGQTQPGGSGCGASSNETSFDSRGNIMSEIDFGRHRTCRAYETSRHFETVRVEGLSDSAADAEICNSDLKTYPVPAGGSQRKITTEWHPLWKLEVRRAEPKRITTTVYNGQKDPIAGDTPDCAPGAPLLPDDVSKIAVVCRRYEQSTADETGTLGFAATELERRKWTYMYNEHGQIKSETDPRGKVTSYEYWPAPTTFTGDGNAARGHWTGDLMSVTNALQQKTEYLEYNKRGQPLTIKYANGSQELREYHTRGWLSKTTLVPAGNGTGQVTTYEYYDTGLLKKVTQPDGSFASYTWDDAHRLTDVVDSVGNKVHYELDNEGNRTAEQFKDPQGTLTKTITRTFDALGRMQSSTGLQ